MFDHNLSILPEFVRHFQLRNGPSFLIVSHESPI